MCENRCTRLLRFCLFSSCLIALRLLNFRLERDPLEQSYTRLSCFLILGQIAAGIANAVQSFALYGLQTPYKACTKLVLAKTEFLHAKLCKLCKLCMACKRLTKLRFVWLANALQSFALYGEKFCRHTKLCFVRLAKRSFARSFAAFGEEFCVQKLCFCKYFCEPKLCFGTLRFAIQSFALVPLCFQKLRANLWFASLTKQSFVWRQNSSPKVAKLRANLWFASLTKQSFVWRQNFVQNFSPYKALLCKAFASHTKLTKRSFVQAL